MIKSRAIRRCLALVTSLAMIVAMFTFSASAATVKNNTSAKVTHSLATTALSISNIYSDVVTNTSGGNYGGTLPFGNYLIFWITANGGSGNYQYQMIVEHQNQYGDGSGTVEYISDYSSNSTIFYQPAQVGYYGVIIQVKDTSTGEVVRQLYMPTTSSVYIWVK